MAMSITASSPALSQLWIPDDLSSLSPRGLTLGARPQQSRSQGQLQGQPQGQLVGSPRPMSPSEARKEAEADERANGDTVQPLPLSLPLGTWADHSLMAASASASVSASAIMAPVASASDKSFPIVPSSDAIAGRAPTAAMWELERELAQLERAQTSGSSHGDTDAGDGVDPAPGTLSLQTQSELHKLALPLRSTAQANRSLRGLAGDGADVEGTVASAPRHGDGEAGRQLNRSSSVAAVEAQLSVLSSEVKAMHLANDELDQDNVRLARRLAKTSRERDAWAERYEALYAHALACGVPLHDNDAFAVPVANFDRGRESDGNGDNNGDNNGDGDVEVPRKRMYSVRSSGPPTPQLPSQSALGITFAPDPAVAPLPQAPAPAAPAPAPALVSGEPDTVEPPAPSKTRTTAASKPISSSSSRPSTPSSLRGRSEERKVAATTANTATIMTSSFASVPSPPLSLVSVGPATPLDLPADLVLPSASKGVGVTSFPSSSPPPPVPQLLLPAGAGVGSGSGSGSDLDPSVASPAPIPGQGPDQELPDSSAVGSFLTTQTNKLVECVGGLLLTLRHPQPDTALVGVTLEQMLAIVRAVSVSVPASAGIPNPASSAQAPAPVPAPDPDSDPVVDKQEHEHELLRAPSAVLKRIWDKWRLAPTPDAAYAQLDKPALARACWALAKALKALRDGHQLN